MTQRLLALVAAVAMIAGSIALRGWLDDRGGGDGANTDGRGGRDGGDLVVACLDELAEVCDALDALDGLKVRRESFAQTTSAAADPRDDIVGWVTLDPLAAVIDGPSVRGGGAASFGAPTTIARSPLVAVAWRERVGELTDECGEAVTWTCVADAAGSAWVDLGGRSSWGEFDPAPGDVVHDGGALLSVAWISGGLLGRADYATNDFADDEFRARLRRLAAAAPADTVDPLDELLRVGPASHDLAVALEADALDAVDGTRYEADLQVLMPAPSTVASLVVVPRTGADRDDRDRLVDIVRDDELGTRLAAIGWRAPGHTPPPPFDPDIRLPADDGLPAAGVLEALRSLWQEVS